MAENKDTAPQRKTLDELLEFARERGKKAPTAAAGLTALAQLPVWPESVRAVPNGFLRSALFGAIAKGRRRYVNGEDLASIEGMTIRYKGERLDQSDLDVWESVLHAVRLQELGSQCRLTSYALLKLMGLTDTGKNRVTLQNRIERLVANALTVKQGRYTYIGSLISFAAKDEDTQEWVIELDPRLRPLFAADQFTQIEWTVRHELNGQQLAQWLHGFYASHAKPFPMKVETLHRLCGSGAELRRYRQTLGDALAAVAEASTAHGQPFSYDIRGDLVHVQKLAIGTQRRHLTKKASTPRKPRG
jgi:hypothetical protein